MAPKDSSLPNSMMAKPLSAAAIHSEKVDSHCDVHGAFQAVQIQYPGGRTFTMPCDICHASRIQPVQQEAAKKAEVTLVNKLAWSGIPQRFINCSFDNYQVTDALRVVFESCKAYAENFALNRRLGTCAILCGDVGTGKTHLATAITRQVIASNMTAKYETIASALRKVRETYRKDSKITEQQIIDSMAKPDLLVLDEVGVQSGSDAELNTLFDIINSRYQQEKPTLVLSNLDGAEIKQSIGYRSYDRLRENGGKYFVFKGESYRSIKKEQV